MDESVKAKKTETKNSCLCTTLNLQKEVVDTGCFAAIIPTYRGFVLFLPVPTPSFIVLYVHKNHKAYWELAKMGEEGDHIPITTLSPPE